MISCKLGSLLCMKIVLDYYFKTKIDRNTRNIDVGTKIVKHLELVSIEKNCSFARKTKRLDLRLILFSFHAPSIIESDLRHLAIAQNNHYVESMVTSRWWLIQKSYYLICFQFDVSSITRLHMNFYCWWFQSAGLATTGKIDGKYISIGSRLASM